MALFKPMTEWPPDCRRNALPVGPCDQSLPERNVAPVKVTPEKKLASISTFAALPGVPAGGVCANAAPGDASIASVQTIIAQQIICMERNPRGRSEDVRSEFM